MFIVTGIINIPNQEFALFDQIDPKEFEGRSKREIAFSLIVAEAFDGKCFHPKEWERFGITQNDRCEVIREMYAPKPASLHIAG